MTRAYQLIVRGLSIAAFVVALTTLSFMASVERADAQAGPPIGVGPAAGIAASSTTFTPLAVFALAAPACMAVSPMVGTALLQREMTAAEVARSSLTCLTGPIGLLVGPSLFPDAVKPTAARPVRNGGQGPRGPNRNFNLPPAGAPYVPNEVLIDAGLASEAAINRLAARLQITRLETQSFALTGRSLHRWRIDGNRSVTEIIRALSRNGRIARAQPNYIYRLAQQNDAPAAPPRAMQYVVEKLKLAETHRITGGDNVTVAVIDAAIDTAHPDLAGVIAGTFDAAGGAAKPHPHGTGMAGAIASHTRLLGFAPKARILAVRAFADGATAEATTFAILKGLDWSAAQSARIINMSFAGPSDPLMSDMLGRAGAKGIVLIAAVGNAGPRSPPLYPAAYPGVIGVTAVDAEDKIFSLANRGAQVQLAAPGVDILVPAPDAGYQVTSGTSVAAAHVSGVAALVLARAPGLKPDDVRRILIQTAIAVGGQRRSNDYGVGLVDPLRAVTNATPR